MTLYIIGLGLWNHKDISIRGLEIIRSCKALYLESYTSLLSCNVKELETFYGREIIVADRSQSEQKINEIINLAKEKDVAFLVIGDPVSATTHMEIVKSCMGEKVPVSVIHNASVFSAIGITGLQPYKFGKTTSIPFLERVPNLETPYHIIKQNQSIGAHTLCLLDIMVDNVSSETGGRVSSETGDITNTKFMGVNEGIEVLEDIEKRLGEKVITDDTLVVGCARLGHENFIVKFGKLSEIKKFDFGGPLHCLVIPGDLHFSEEEMLHLWK